MRTERKGCNNRLMFRAIGVLIILWGLSSFFSQSFSKFDEAGVAVLNTIIIASEHFEKELSASIGDSLQH